MCHSRDKIERYNKPLFLYSFQKKLLFMKVNIYYF